jgi:hypothetical protein
MEKKTRYIKPKKGSKVPVCIECQFVAENLPLKNVAYPSHYGTFIGFTDDPMNDLYFCTCVENAVSNFIELAKIKEAENKFFPIKGNFPFLDSNSIQDPYFQKIKFKEKICHACNLATPTVRFCHEMYGGNFKQFFGWYIQQEFFKTGLSTHFEVIKDKCPEEIERISLQLKAVNAQIEVKKNKIFNRPIFGTYEEEKNYLLEVDLDLPVIEQLEKEALKLAKQIWNQIENSTRQNFGFSKIGSSWVGESILHKIVTRIFQDNQIERNFRPSWFEKLEIDIYVPEKRIGFEYQGKQHFFPVKAWGGEEALKKVQIRDRYKLDLANKLGIKLIIIDYTEPLTETHILEVLRKENIEI